MRWLRAQPRWVWVIAAVMLVAVYVGALALISVVLGSGPVRGLEQAAAGLVGFGLFSVFVACRAKTASRRAARRQRDRMTYETAHRGEDGQVQP